MRELLLALGFTWDQILIAVFGVSAIFLTQSLYVERRKLAPVMGLIGQVGWFYAAFTAKQWGIFLLCFFYTWAWMKGIWQNWIRPKDQVNA